MENAKRLMIVLKGVLLAYFIACVLILLYSMILTYTDISDSTIPTCTFAINIVSVFIASSIMMIKIKKDGLKHGGLIGLIYILLLYILSSITSSGFQLTSYSLITIIFNIILGMIGGIVGVNLAR